MKEENNDNITYYKSRNIIQKRGQVVRRDSLNDTKKKLLALEASKVQNNDTEETIYKITAQEIVDLCGYVKSGALYDYLFNEIYELKGKRVAFTIQDKDGQILEVIESYMENIRINRKNGYATYTIPKTLVEHFKSYSPYAKMNLLDFMPLRSGYAMSLYELLMSWSYRGEVVYTIPQLRDLIEIEDDKYTDACNFVKRVVDKPIQQINERVKEPFEYQVIRGAKKKIEAIRFIIPKPDKSIEQIADNTLEGILGADKAILAIEQYGQEYCDANLKYTLSKETKSKTAYLINALKNDWAEYGKTLEFQKLQKEATQAAEQKEKGLQENASHGNEEIIHLFSEFKESLCV